MTGKNAKIVQTLETIREITANHAKEQVGFASEKIKPIHMETNEEFIKRKNADFSKKKLIPLKDVGRKGKFILEREAWRFMPQHNLSNKVFCIERLRLVKIEGKITHTEVKVGNKEYRFGYYIVGKIGIAKDKWWWGQSCPLIPIQDFKKLIKLAEDEGTILP